MTLAITEQSSALLGVYRQSGPTFVAGHGCWLTGDDGRDYLDFTSGIAVNSLGYGDQDVARAVQKALDSGLIHASNLFRTQPAAELAEWLAARSFADRVFFCNSGAEANEGAIKFARRFARAQGHEQRTQIVAFSGGFHGRTMGALAATDRPAYQEPFKPLMPGVRFCTVGDVKDVEEALAGGRVAAAIIEPIQGAGGVMPVPAAFLKALRYLCDEAGALLVFDEVQTGLGRTGHLWAHEGAGVAPDLMTIAKPLAGGLPMGAVLMTERVASALQPGDHGTTFGGGPLVAAAALATCAKIASPGFLDAVKQKGHTLANRLGSVWMRHPEIRAVRGTGMIWGLELSAPTAGEVVARAMEAGLLICSAGPNVVRLLPPLVASDEELTRGVDILDEVL